MKFRFSFMRGSRVIFREFPLKTEIISNFLRVSDVWVEMTGDSENIRTWHTMNYYVLDKSTEN